MTATQWFGYDSGLRILEVNHGIDDTVVVAHITNGVLEEEKHECIVQHDNDGRAFFTLYDEWYYIDEFMKDNI